jgi:hypothetical protein
MRNLPVDKHGRPVPWFAAWIDGEPDFRIVAPGKLEQAIRGDGRCWVCGVPFLTWQDRAFLVGPMCTVNRISAEPPVHKSCGVYSATHCPFLTVPNMIRRPRHGVAAEAVNPAGTMISRNPGVCVLWVVNRQGRGSQWHPFPDENGGVLFAIGEPRDVMWFAHGRKATRDEVLASIDSGLPILRELAQAGGADDMQVLERMHERALEYVPRD